MLKGVGFKFQVQLTAEKGRQVKLDRSRVRLNRSKIVGTEFCRIFKPGPRS